MKGCGRKTHLHKPGKSTSSLWWEKYLYGREDNLWEGGREDTHLYGREDTSLWEERLTSLWEGFKFMGGNTHLYGREDTHLYGREDTHPIISSPLGHTSLMRYNMK